MSEDRGKNCPHGFPIEDFEELGLDGKPTGWYVPMADCRSCPNGQAGTRWRPGDDGAPPKPRPARGRLEIRELQVGPLSVVISATVRTPEERELFERLVLSAADVDRSYIRAAERDGITLKTGETKS